MRFKSLRHNADTDVTKTFRNVSHACALLPSVIFKHQVGLMERNVQRRLLSVPGQRPGLWLAATDGHRMERPAVAPIGGPEAPMAVRFEGLTDAQQRAALAAFPGGKRFVLAS